MARDVDKRRKITFSVDEEEYLMLEDLARANNCSVEQVLVRAALSSVRKTPRARRALFNELTVLAGSLRAVYNRLVRTADIFGNMDADKASSLADLDAAVARAVELMDIIWEILKREKAEI